MHGHVPSAYIAGKLTDSGLACGLLIQWQGLVHRPTDLKDLCTDTAARTRACTDCKDSCMYRLQGLMHVQIARTHASVYRLQGLMHVQTARTHACTDCKDSCIIVPTARTHACTDCKDSCMYRLQGLMHQCTDSARTHVCRIAWSRT